MWSTRSPPVASDFTSLSSAEPPSASELLQVHLYREDGFYFRSPLAHTTHYKDSRPSHCPSSIDIFLWGGLSTSLEEVMLPYVERVNGAYRLAFVLVFVPLLWWFTVGWVGIQTRDSPWYFLILFSMPLLLSIILDCSVTRRVLQPLPSEIENALNDLRPHFHRAGYDLQLVVRKAACLGSVVYVSLRAMGNNNITVGVGPNENPQSSGCDAVRSSGGPKESPEDFRVAVYGRKAVVTSLIGSKEYHFMNGRPVELQSIVDVFTWGAVANEVRPLTIQYMHTRINKFLWLLLLLQLFVWLPESVEESSQWFFFVALTYSIIFVVGDAPAEQVFPVILWLRHDALQSMEDKLRELSPQVSAHSGYALSFQVERNCCGMATDAYVHFQPVSSYSRISHSAQHFV